ncbi:TIGR02281 family clan AA aspartic protease [Paraglaciecola sp. 2405UD69-4]|uniref:retropepsin-like aspartic protease family protein n=1 Tax=Paraglaciecola sp. 2405UD69-4 TaxID=3391836 RepID=UPI0039C9B2B9
MNRWLTILLILLTLSVSLNVYLVLFEPAQRTLAHTSSLPETTESPPTITQADTSQRHAVKLFENLESAPINSSEGANREQLLEQANQWLQSQAFSSLAPFLQNYLKQYPQDMDFLLIEAKMKVETELLSDAISYYYDLLRYPITSAQQSEIEQQISQLSQGTISQLERTYSWDILAMFVEPLLQLEPTNRLYILSLASAYAEQLQGTLMENVLAALEYNDPDAQKVRDILLAQLPSPESDTEPESPLDTTDQILTNGIPLKQVGDQFLVSGNLSGNPVSLLIDTGASITAISQQYFDRLSNRYKRNHIGRFTIGTAAGSVMASIYEFRELTLQHITVQNLPVVVLPMDSMDNADGLLGMNFLREFDFKIDQQQAVLLIQ